MFSQQLCNNLNDLNLNININNNNYNSYQIFNTPIKENIYINGMSTNKKLTPINDDIYDEIYLNNSNCAKPSQKIFLFNVSKEKYDSPSGSSIKHYIKSDDINQNAVEIIHLKDNNNINNYNNNKLFTSPTKKNLFSVFENTIKNQKIIKTPLLLKKKKNIFECLSTEKTVFTSSAKKKRRDRKSKQQLQYLNKFYNDNKKRWNREDIKMLSRLLSIKETKVYKWLWDRKNKDLKKMKFFVSK